MDNITTNFGDVLLWSFWIFVFVGALTLWVLAFVDLVGDQTLSGWVKAGWIVVLILVPWVGALVYLLVRDLRNRKLARDIRNEAQ